MSEITVLAFIIPALWKPAELLVVHSGLAANQLPNALWYMEFELAQREPESCKIGCDAFLEICFCFSFVGDCSVCVGFLVDAIPENN